MRKTTPTDILTYELTSSARMSAYIRRLLQRRLNQISRSMKTPGIGGSDAGQYTDELLTILEGLKEIMIYTTRFISNPKATAASEAATSEEVLDELMKGKSK